jgi:hypothetical protein
MLLRESGRERVPMKSLELSILSCMQSVRQHKFFKRKQQGTGAHEEFRVDNSLLDVIPKSTQVLSDKWFEGTAPVSFVFESQQYNSCMDTFNEEVIVPTHLQYMHDIMVHHHNDNITSDKFIMD